ncbi:L,D-transpeptidase family protein [Patulibacter brassicae]|jgi:lipoprotein-anchoring transpeptidase ErfK/SrfK|uniref:L,D-transpeptidase family protein n=1 Tax=Patulibacter brassicae TaxID=1705717 RepID=A0ABU4VJ81_9ACTN|nr:L,D-transpeptidase family protein [Patulibacter brassicae]MDX8151754.1 L,D-transpeptidase family protein [Patulibacter brassicae]
MRASLRAGALASAVPLVLVSAASAQAQDPAPAPAPAAPAAPPALDLKLSIEKAPGNLSFKGSTWRALVVTDRYVPGTKVTFEFTAGTRRTVKRVTLKPVKDSAKGVVRASYRSASASRVVVRTRIGEGQPAAPTGRETQIVQQFTPSVKAGASGTAVTWLQRKLKAKGYVPGRAGRYDARTSRAVLAYRKVTGMALTTQANRAVFEGLRAGKGTFKVRFPSHGRHIEGDIRRQVLALIGEGGKVERIYHTSPGAPATPTIRGTFRVYRKDPGTNAKGMYASSYFIRGYAVHGYPSVPTYRASHGCFRVPMEDARSIYDWIRMGTIVDTYV